MEFGKRSFILLTLRATLGVRRREAYHGIGEDSVIGMIRFSQSLSEEAKKNQSQSLAFRFPMSSEKCARVRIFSSLLLVMLTFWVVLSHCQIINRGDNDFGKRALLG